MLPRDHDLVGGCLAKFHVGEGVRCDVTPSDPEIKDTTRRAHHRVGPRELRWLVNYGVDFANQDKGYLHAPE